MLSRVAESLIWLSRYVERAKRLARLVEMADQLALDYSHPELSTSDLFWKPILHAYGYDQKTIDTHETKEDFIKFLLSDPENDGSVFRSLTFARENARGVREQINTEYWEVLNELFLWCKDRSRSSALVNPAVYGARVRQGCLHLRGLVEEMMPREEAWCFLRLGTMLERADQTSRLLDLKTFMPGKDHECGDAFEPYVWLCIMRGCGAGSQRGFGNTEADWPRLNETLIYSSVFPRSIRYCIKEVNNVLHNLSGSAFGIFNNEVERISGRFLAELDLGSFSGEVNGNLHEFLDDVQKNLSAIGVGIQETYSYTGETMEEEEEQEQSQREE